MMLEITQTCLQNKRTSSYATTPFKIFLSTYLIHHQVAHNRGSDRLKLTSILPLTLRERYGASGGIRIREVYFGKIAQWSTMRHPQNWSTIRAGYPYYFSLEAKFH